MTGPGVGLLQAPVWAAAVVRLADGSVVIVEVDSREGVAMEAVVDSRPEPLPIEAFGAAGRLVMSAPAGIEVSMRGRLCRLQVMASSAGILPALEALADLGRRER